jgi:hypothetical protein
MSESEDASGAPRVDYSSIAVLERQLNRINAKLDELFEKRALAISDGKSKEQLEALNALYASRETKLEAEKKEKEAELKELLTQATTGPLCLSLLMKSLPCFGHFLTLFAPSLFPFVLPSPPQAHLRRGGPIPHYLARRGPAHRGGIEAISTSYSLQGRCGSQDHAHVPHKSG